MELGSVHEYINMWLPLAHSSLHQLEFMSQYGLLCISAELELGIIRVKFYPVVVTCGDSQPVSVMCRDVITTLSDNEHHDIMI